MNMKNLNLSAYAEPNYKELKINVSKFFNLPSHCDIEFYNGASSGIYSIFKYINPKNVSLYLPIYTEYMKIANNLNCKINKINRLDNINKNITKNSLVVFVNPSTPDGQLYNIKTFLSEWKTKNANILLDESFLDFTDYESALPLVNDNMFILKSFSKIFACAGLRIGCVISSKNNIKEIRKTEPPWKLSSLDMHYLNQAIKNKDFLNQTKKLTKLNKHILKQKLIKIDLFDKIFNSCANFILVKLKNIDGYKLQKLLTPYKILIRVCDNFYPLNSKWIRLAVKDELSISLLINALKEIKYKQTQ